MKKLDLTNFELVGEAARIAREHISDIGPPGKEKNIYPKFKRPAERCALYSLCERSAVSLTSSLENHLTQFVGGSCEREGAKNSFEEDMNYTFRLHPHR